MTAVRALGGSLLLLTAVPCGAQDWPSFRGPGACGVAEDADPPVEWDVGSGEGVRWRRAIPGLAHSSPIVTGGLVFVTTAVGSEEEPVFELATSGRAVTGEQPPLEWRLLALDRGTGEVLWERTCATGMPRTKRHLRSSPCNATPATDGEHVVAVMGSQGLYCYSVEGELAWKKDLGVLDGGYVGKPEYQWGSASSPILHRGLVIVQVDKVAGSYLAAFKALDGEEAWRVAREELPTWCTPTVYEHGGKAVLVANGGEHVRAYDAATGEELWSFADHAEVKVPTPFVADGRVYFAGGAPRGREMFALRVGDGGTGSKETAGSLAWRIPNGGPYTVTPIVCRGRFFTCSDAGILGCYDAATGRMLYRERLDAEFSASPVAAAGRIYLASHDGDVLVIRAGDELELLARNAMGEPCMATPALSGDLLLVRTTKALYAIGS